MISDWSPAEENPLSENGVSVKNYLYTNDNFPCLVKNGEKPESLVSKKNPEYYNRVARNAFRYLMGWITFRESHLMTFDNFKALFWKRNPDLLKALRVELKNILYNAYTLLESGKCNAEAEKRMEILINNLLSAVPYFDPDPEPNRKKNSKAKSLPREIISIPQKINGVWEYKTYHYDKIDISPKKGLLAKLMDNRDRLYAYGLVPLEQDASPYLLLMGSHYPSGQGALINWLFNFKPKHSVGEGHDLTEIEPWLKKHPGAKVTGHSKGGTLAMIVAALFPDLIAEAHCLNPALLDDETIKRLDDALNLKQGIKLPLVNVYVQVDDPAFLLGHKVLAGAKTYSVGDKIHPGSFFPNHVVYNAARRETIINTLNTVELDKAFSLRQREFIGDVKQALNWVIFPSLYAFFIYKNVFRKVEDTLTNNPVAKVIYPPIKLMVDIITAITFLSALTAVAAFTVATAALFSGIKLAFKALFSKKPGPGAGAEPVVPAVTLEPQNNDLKPDLGTTAQLGKTIKLQDGVQVEETKKDIAEPSPSNLDLVNQNGVQANEPKNDTTLPAPEIPNQAEQVTSGEVLSNNTAPVVDTKLSFGM